MPKVLHKHLDGMEEIEARIQDEIDGMIAAIDVKELMKDPRGVMVSIADEVAKILEEKYIPMAGSDGFDLLETLNRYDEQGREIMIDPSKDGTKNA